MVLTPDRKKTGARTTVYKQHHTSYAVLDDVK